MAALLTAPMIQAGQTVEVGRGGLCGVVREVGGRGRGEEGYGLENHNYVCGVGGTY
jgi:hypothetical protein